MKLYKSNIHFPEIPVKNNLFLFKIYSKCFAAIHSLFYELYDGHHPNSEIMFDELLQTIISAIKTDMTSSNKKMKKN